jgi:ribosomal protein L16 Arg81 hydroxylase
VTTTGGRGTQVIDRFDLRRLIQPVDVRRFLENYWETAPLIIHRRDPKYYQSVLSLDDVDHILAMSSLRSPEIRLARDGHSLPLSVLRVSELSTNAVMHDALIEEYRRGATIILQFLHERWSPLAELCTLLGETLSASLQANVYLTPRNSQGFAAHYDDHDVFVLQVAGRKTWRVYSRQVSILPMDEPHRKPNITADEPCEKFVLAAGDCVYIPRGWIHEAASGDDSSSVHVTLGVNTIKWADMITRAVESTFDDPRFRRSLPPGFATDIRIRRQAIKQFEQLSEALLGVFSQSEALVEQAAVVASRGAQKISHGRLQDLESERLVDSNTRVRRRVELDHRIDHGEADLLLAFNGKAMILPPKVGLDLEFMSAVDEFVPAELPGGMDVSGKTALVRRLIQEGFLEIARPGTTEHET